MSAVNTGGIKGFEVKQGLKIADYIAASSEPCEKFAKVGHKVIEFCTLLTGKTSVVFSAVSSRLKSTSEIFESVGLIGRLKELACPDAEGKYFLRKSSWQKCADRIFLTIGSVFKTVNIAAKFAFVNLGKCAKFALGKVPVLKLIPDTAIVISSFFSIWDNRNIMNATDKKLAAAKDKIEKWEKRTPEHQAKVADDVRASNPEAIAGLKAYYEEKVQSLEGSVRELESLKALDASKNKEISKKIAIVEKYRNRLDLIAKQQHEALANELSKVDVVAKQRRWSVEYSNHEINKNKAWLGVAGSAVKIFAIVVGTALAFVGISSLPWVLFMTAVGITIDSLGLAKSLYSYTATPQDPFKAVATV